MRIALLSDMHGNTIALDAVLVDIQAQANVDAYWVLGDFAAIGPDPVGALQRLRELPNARFVRGNTDDYLVSGKRPLPTLEAAMADPRVMSAFLQMTESFAWTQGAVTAAGYLEWLKALPIEQRLTLPNGARLLGVHASRGQCDGRGIRPGLSEAELRETLHGCDADLVCVGHTHWAMDLQADSVRVINLGSVSNPFPPDLRASYVMLDADPSGYQVQHRRVDYDHAAVVAAVERAQHPAAAFITRIMRGQNPPPWQRV